ncbi:MAG TPA: hypothetical protein VGN09_27715 [Vicinamibacteria bacterium]
MAGSLLAGVPAAALLLWHSAYWHAGADLSSLTAPRRYWEDLAVAATRYLDGDGEAERVSINSADGAELRLGFQRFLTRSVAEEGTPPWKLWRTIQVRPLLKGRRLMPREIDDPGRAGLLTAGFRLLRGVSPFLPLWVGALVAAPILAWTGEELARAGRTAAGLAFTLLLACSPYVIDSLSLPYSAVGFYVIALVAIVPLATYAVSAEVRVAGLAARALAAGAVFALCVLCRSGSLFLLPGYILALVAGAGRLATSRAAAGTSASRAVHAVIFLAIFIAPYALLRPPRHHEVWLGLWEGLGDFDRTKGHAWDDDVAREVLRRAGMEPPLRYPVWENAPENEALFRRLVLTDVRSDPAWYAGILARRLWSTLSQAKLRPWAPRDGVSIAPRQSPSEGAIDTYYSMATPADRVGLGPWRGELPLIVLWGPTLLLILLYVRARSTGRLRPWPSRQGSALLVLSCAAVAALGLPVLFTTAAGLETQAFVVVYFLGVAFLLDEALRYRRAAGLPAG